MPEVSLVLRFESNRLTNQSLIYNKFATVLDSMSTFPAGVLSSTTTELGDFDSCLSVDGAFQGQALVGKYCLATVHLPKRQLYTPFAVNQSALKPAWIGRILEQWHNNDNYYGLATAVCFPSLCHQEEIQSILRACKLTISWGFVC